MIIMVQDTLLINNARNFVLILVTAALLAGCGGGGSALMGSGTNAITMHTPASPTPVPTSTPIATVLPTATLNGASGFTTRAGFTVYVFDLDLTSPGHSTCNASNGCAENWPHVAPPAGVDLKTPFSMITRDDGSLQLAYAGRPLYTFIVDQHPGETTGDGVNAFGGLWHIARPQSTTPASMPTPQPTRTPY
jgi:predicted lipoprotein with Yx(FWY)xxD motif